MAEEQFATVTPEEFKLALRLKRSRFLWHHQSEAELQYRLDRVSKYMITRLNRRYPTLGVSRPIWSVDQDPNGFGLPKVAYCYFNYIDMSPYTEKRGVALLPGQYHEITLPLNRAARR